MVLRLVLVGIVAGLGVSPPAECELAGWTRSVQARLVVWLAKADALRPLDEGVDAGDGRGPGEQADAPDFEEPAVDRPGTSSPAPVVEGRGTVADVVAEEDALEAPWADEAGVLAEEPAALASAPVDAEEVADAPAFDAIVEEMVADFAREADAKAATPASVATAVDVAQPEATEDLYPGEAFALNRMADGLEAPPGPADAVVTSPAGHQLSHAVRLTRDAVYAWMHLIQSPAIVTISR